MTALQVRDFPEGLYADLKAFAEASHRSMSQQVIVAVEEMLRHGRGNDRPHRSRDALGTRVAFDSEAARQARIQKRSELFARIHEQAACLPKDLPDPVELVHESRRAREEHLMDVLEDAAGASA